MKQYDVIIAGAGIAGYSAAKVIKEIDRKASVLLLNNEDRAPYKRTKISKFIREGFTKDQFRFSPPSWYFTQRIDLLSYGMKHIKTQKKYIETNNGLQFGWKKLILATGATPNKATIRITGGNNILTLRKASDSEKIIQKAQQAKSVCIIGAGVEGLEIADQLSGREIIIIDKNPRFMSRHLNTYLSDYLHSVVEKNKIRCMTSTQINEIEKSESGSGTVVHLTNGDSFETDLMIESIGIRPNKKIAADAGIKTNNGILVDEYLRTSEPDIYAAGDVAEHPGNIITDLYHAAELQGEIAGRNAMGENLMYEQPAFRLKTEIFGHYFFSMNKPADEMNFQGEIVEVKKHKAYYCFYYLDNQLSGLVMADDKKNAKKFETAQREHWTKEKTEEYFFS